MRHQKGAQLTARHGRGVCGDVLGQINVHLEPGWVVAKGNNLHQSVTVLLGSPINNLFLHEERKLEVDKPQAEPPRLYSGPLYWVP